MITCVALPVDQRASSSLSSSDILVPIQPTQQVHTLNPGLSPMDSFAFSTAATTPAALGCSPVEELVCLAKASVMQHQHQNQLASSTPARGSDIFVASCATASAASGAASSASASAVSSSASSARRKSHKSSINNNSGSGERRPSPIAQRNFSPNLTVSSSSSSLSSSDTHQEAVGDDHHATVTAIATVASTSALRAASAKDGGVVYAADPAAAPASASDVFTSRDVIGTCRYASGLVANMLATDDSPAEHPQHQSAPLRYSAFDCGAGIQHGTPLASDFLIDPVEKSHCAGERHNDNGDDDDDDVDAIIAQQRRLKLQQQQPRTNRSGSSSIIALDDSFSDNDDDAGGDSNERFENDERKAAASRPPTTAPPSSRASSVDIAIQVAVPAAQCTTPQKRANREAPPPTPLFVARPSTVSTASFSSRQKLPVAAASVLPTRKQSVSRANHVQTSRLVSSSRPFSSSAATLVAPPLPASSTQFVSASSKQTLSTIPSSSATTNVALRPPFVHRSTRSASPGGNAALVRSASSVRSSFAASAACTAKKTSVNAVAVSVINNNNNNNSVNVTAVVERLYSAPNQPRFPSPSRGPVSQLAVGVFARTTTTTSAATAAAVSPTATTAKSMTSQPQRKVNVAAPQRATDAAAAAAASASVPPSSLPVPCAAVVATAASSSSNRPRFSASVVTSAPASTQNGRVQPARPRSVSPDVAAASALAGNTSSTNHTLLTSTGVLALRRKSPLPVSKLELEKQKKMSLLSAKPATAHPTLVSASVAAGSVDTMKEASAGSTALRGNSAVAAGAAPSATRSPSPLHSTINDFSSVLRNNKNNNNNNNGAFATSSFPRKSASPSLSSGAAVARKATTPSPAPSGHNGLLIGAAVSQQRKSVSPCVDLWDRRVSSCDRSEPCGMTTPRTAARRDVAAQLRGRILAEAEGALSRAKEVVEEMADVGVQRQMRRESAMEDDAMRYFHSRKLEKEREERERVVTTTTAVAAGIAADAEADSFRVVSRSDTAATSKTAGSSPSTALTFVTASAAAAAPAAFPVLAQSAETAILSTTTGARLLRPMKTVSEKMRMLSSSHSVRAPSLSAGSAPTVRVGAGARRFVSPCPVLIAGRTSHYIQTIAVPAKTAAHDVIWMQQQQQQHQAIHLGARGSAAPSPSAASLVTVNSAPSLFAGIVPRREINNINNGVDESHLHAWLARTALPCARAAVAAAIDEHQQLQQHQLQHHGAHNYNYMRNTVRPVLGGHTAAPPPSRENSPVQEALTALAMHVLHAQQQRDEHQQQQQQERVQVSSIPAAAAPAAAAHDGGEASDRNCAAAAAAACSDVLYRDLVQNNQDDEDEHNNDAAAAAIVMPSAIKHHHQSLSFFDTTPATQHRRRPSAGSTSATSAAFGGAHGASVASSSASNNMMTPTQSAMTASAQQHQRRHVQQQQQQRVASSTSLSSTPAAPLESFLRMDTSQLVFDNSAHFQPQASGLSRPASRHGSSQQLPDHAHHSTKKQVPQQQQHSLTIVVSQQHYR